MTRPDCGCRSVGHEMGCIYFGDSDRKGDWMETFTGKRFYPMDPRANEIDIRDIAHALSNLCRYNGHTTRFYSVAQHCVEVSELLERVGPIEARWGLLHDAAETYIGDMIRPLKPSFPTFQEIERQITRAIAIHFDLPFPVPSIVKTADLKMLATEARDLMQPDRWQHWNLPVPPRDEKVVPWDATELQVRFMVHYQALWQ